MVKPLAIAVVASALSLAWTGRARADDDPQLSPAPVRETCSIEADARYMWFARPPSLSLYEPGRYGSHIDGSEGLGHGIEPLQGLAAHFALIYHPNDVLVIPTLGVTFGGAVGGWGTSTRYDGLTFSPDGLSFFATIDVIGIGVQAKLGSVTLSATTRAGIDVFAVGGRLSDPQIAEDATGKAYAIALRGDLRACVRAAHDGSSRVCLFGGPNFVEGSHLMNGGYAGIGATF